VTAFTATLHRFESGQGRLRVVCQGQIELDATGRLQGVIEEALRQQPPIGIELDLSGVDFIDSTGLQAVMQALLRLDDEQVAWNVVTSPPVQRLLELVGVARLSSADGGWLASGGYGRE
jgi:anti-sigma B factor antagonist